MLDDVVRAVTYVADVVAYYAVAYERYKYFDNSLPKNTLVAVIGYPSRYAHRDRGRSRCGTGAVEESRSTDLNHACLKADSAIALRIERAVGLE
jgi:hypothetical protein